jgi:Cell division protein
MSAERKKLVWLSISAVAFIIIVCAAGFILFRPQTGSSQAPATIGNSAPPKAQDPQDFLSSPPATAPVLEQPKAQDGDVIVVYGDKPSLPESATSQKGSASQSAGSSPSSAGGSAASEQSSASSTEAAASEPAAKPKAASVAKSPAPAKKSPAKPAQAAPAAPAAKNNAVAATAKPAQAAPKASEYWIQAAAFASRGKADELKQSLADKGMAALIVVGEVSGKSYYRVRIGPYSTQAEADGWLAKIKELPGCTEAQVRKTAKKS